MHSTSGACSAELVLVLGLLCEDATGASKQVADLGLSLLRESTELAGHLALNTAHARAQCPQRLLHTLELPGVGVAPDLCGQPGGGAVVVLAKCDAVLASHLHQVLAALLQ